VSIWDSDQITVNQTNNVKRFNKPVIYGEHGNSSDTDQKKRPPGVGGVWDPESHLRMRVRNWTALFNEASFVFWNTSYAKDGHYMNIWLGPKEREYVKAMQDYAYCLGGNIRISKVKLSDPDSARAYALASDSRIGIYIVHSKDYKNPLKKLVVTLDVPKQGKAFWYSPENGSIISETEIQTGAQTLTVPDFNIDIALLIGVGSPPDSDGDGKPNNIDNDDDNDGVPDIKDAFPLEPEEWEYKDGDLIGDNMDADDDGDGVDRANTVPWDAYSFDPKKWSDK
jgi:hypothetical protein